MTVKGRTYLINSFIFTCLFASSVSAQDFSNLEKQTQRFDSIARCSGFFRFAFASTGKPEYEAASNLLFREYQNILNQVFAPTIEQIGEDFTFKMAWMSGLDYEISYSEVATNQIIQATNDARSADETPIWKNDLNICLNIVQRYEP